MAYNFNGTIATQGVVFRGTSNVKVVTTTPAFPNCRAIESAVYVLKVAGGVSGTFGAVVYGAVGGVAGSTVALAGVTGVNAVGTYVLFPVGYSVSGSGTLADVAAGAMINRIDQTVPPSFVAFQSNTATAGISATLTVSAAMYAPR